MGLDIWFAEDIRNALLAANEASAATAAVIAEAGRLLPAGSEQAVTDSAELLAVSLRAYREGYKAALATVALAFGIAPQTIILRPAQDSALRPFDFAQGGLSSGQGPSCYPKWERAEGREKASLQTSRSGEEP